VRGKRKKIYKKRKGEVKKIKESNRYGKKSVSKREGRLVKRCLKKEQMVAKKGNVCRKEKKKK